MIARLPLRGATPHPTLQQLIERHGSRRVILALIATLILIRKPRRKRQRRGIPTHQLGAHLRQDIGLPPHVPESPRHWDFRP